MSDNLEELLTGLRASALHEIQPPGAAAARRTVRRRRVTALVASACAVLVAVGGTFALFDRPAAERSPVLPAATPQSPAPGELEQLAATALAKLTDDRPALAHAAPVVAGQTHQKWVYLPLLTVRAACAGTGQMTLVVRAHWRDDEVGELGTVAGRLRVPCGADPVPVSQDIDVAGQTYLTFQLDDAESAADRAGFAFRATGRGGPPMAPDDPRADLQSILGLNRPEEMSAGGLGEAYRPSDTFQINSDHEEFRPGDRYRLVMGCVGTGTYHLRVQRGATILAERSVPCGLPPERKEFVLDAELGKGVSFWDRYDGPAGAQAPAGWRLTVR